MIFNKSKLAIASIGIAALLSACTLKQMAKIAEEQKLTVTPSPLELHGDSVIFEVSAVLPVKTLKKNKLYTIKTWYEFGDPTEELAQLEFQDTEFPNQKVEEPSIVKTFSFAFKPNMETGDLKIKGVASNLSKTKYEETSEMIIAQGLITTSRLFNTTSSATLADHGYNNEPELVPHNVQFFFEQGSSKLRSSEVLGAQGKILNAFIASKNKTRTVTIYGSHSPEGLESINSKLAEERATVIRNYYSKKMREYDYKGLADSIKFETKTIFQDWKAFNIELAKNTTLTAEQKAGVAKIVNGSAAFETKANELSKLSYYKTLLNDVYPALRISKTEILSEKPKKTDAEISVLARGIYEGKITADTLSYQELMYAASLTPLLEEQLKIYEAASKSNDSWKSHNNIGAIYITLANKSTDANTVNDYISKAQSQFELAVNKEENAITLSNLANTYWKQGDIAKADELYSKAKQSPNLTPEVTSAINGNTAAIEIRKGNYSNAIKLLSQTTESAASNHNLGLAHLLIKDYTKASNALETSTSANANNAITFYLRAVLAAREGNATALGIHLASAVKKDVSLKEKALNDLEFINFRSNPVFTNALK